MKNHNFLAVMVKPDGIPVAATEFFPPDGTSLSGEALRLAAEHHCDDVFVFELSGGDAGAAWRCIYRFQAVTQTTAYPRGGTADAAQ